MRKLLCGHLFFVAFLISDANCFAQTWQAHPITSGAELRVCKEAEAPQSPNTPVISSLLIPAQESQAIKKDQRRYPEVQGYITTTDGVRLYYRKLGNGRNAVVFLHGGPGLSMRDGGMAMEPLAQRHTLIMYDQRGGGRSQLIQDKRLLTAAHSVRDLEALRQHFRIEKMALVGLSWGSGLAALYAEAHPDRISRIVFLAPMPVALNPFAKERSAKVRSSLAPADIERLRKLHEQLRTAPDEQLQAICREEDRLFFKAYVLSLANYNRVRSDICEDPPAAIRNASLINSAVVGSLGDFDLRPVLSRLRIPVLVVEGQESIVPLEATREWAKAPGARLLLIPNAGHASFIDQPEILIQNLEVFLRGDWPRASRAVIP